MKKKVEPKSLGPLRDEEDAPWNGITLNRCLVVAAIAALLSVGFQVLQDAVDSDDDLAEVEAEAWTPPNPNDQLSEPWFFEGWFDSSKPELSTVEDSPDIEETVSPDIEEPEPMLKEPELPSAEEPELTSVEKDEVEETEADLLIQEPLESGKVKERKDKENKTEQWGLKAKGKYMEVKASKIRRAPENGLQKRDVFPFPKKSKESTKSYPEVKEKSYKEKNYQEKKNEKKYDHPKKQEFGKSFKNEREEPNRYFKQDKGRKEGKENKGYRPYHQEKDYKKKQDSRRHG